MPLTAAAREDRFVGAFLGMAIGDALGFPLRGVPASSLAQLPGLAEDFAHRPRGKYAKGQFSDDTQLMLAVAQSVTAEGKVDGASVGAHLAWTWREGVLLSAPRSLHDAAERLANGMPWVGAGAPAGVKDPSALSRGLVVGLIQPEVLGRLPHDAGVVSVVTHKDPACAAATAAYARAVSLGLDERPRTAQAFCEAVALAAGVHEPGLAGELRQLPRLLSWDEDRAFSLLRRVGLTATEARAEGIPAHVYPVLLCALFASLKFTADYRTTVAKVLRQGGEVDVCAALTGGLLGAHLGTAVLPARLRRNVLYAEEVAKAASGLAGVHARVAVPALVRR